MFAGLSLDQAPPFEAPLKFFLTAPLFAILSGVVALFFQNFNLYDFHLIASIHLLTLGYMVMIVFGALQQMLPVVAGAVIPKAKMVANTTYSFLFLGILSFFIGFFFFKITFLSLASIFLFLGVVFFTLIALSQLLKVTNKSFIVLGMIFALIFLLGALFFGLYLISTYIFSNLSSSHYDFALIHYNLIFFGFLFLLIVAITIQVVPMFWVAPNFSNLEQKIIILSTVFLTLFYCVALFFQFDVSVVYKIFMGGIVSYFALSTITKLKKRRRKLKDIAVFFYLLSMIFLLLGVVFWISSIFIKLPDLTLGILFGFGFIISLMNGMIYKIVPFLTWFHLNSKGKFNIPTMRDMIPSKYTQVQFYLHLGATIIISFGSLIQVDNLIKFGLVVFVISNAFLFFNLLQSAGIYKKNK